MEIFVNPEYRDKLEEHGFKGITMSQESGNYFERLDSGYMQLRQRYEVTLELDERGLDELREMLNDMVGVPRPTECNVKETIIRYRMKHK